MTSEQPTDVWVGRPRPSTAVPSTHVFWLACATDRLDHAVTDTHLEAGLVAGQGTLLAAASNAAAVAAALKMADRASVVVGSRVASQPWAATFGVAEGRELARPAARGRAAQRCTPDPAHAPEV